MVLQKQPIDPNLGLRSVTAPFASFRVAPKPNVPFHIIGGTYVKPSPSGVYGREKT